MANVILNEKVVDFDACVNMMDDEIRENLHMDYCWESEQEFLNVYCEAHIQKFGEEFTV